MLNVTEGAWMESDSKSDKDSESIADLIAIHVNSPDFLKNLLSTIAQVDNDTNRAKLMFELIAYTAPKIKAIDQDDKQGTGDITINFIEATDPEGDEDGGN